MTAQDRPLAPDDTEYFLESFLGPEWGTVPLVFQTFDDNKDRKRAKGPDPYAKVRIGTWDEHRVFLTTLNKNGAGIFLTVNHTEGGRKKEHLRAIRAVWCEWDDTTRPPPEWPLAPHITVESSPGKFHLYWRVYDMTPGDHWRVMACLVGQWGSDKEACDVTRVLRLPGFVHQKIDQAKGLTGAPFLVRVVAAEAPEVLPPYLTEELIRGFKVREWEAAQGQAPPQGDTKPRASRIVTPLNLAEVKDALKHLSAEDRGVWLRIGMALSSTNNQAAFAVWNEWSQQSAKYDAEDQYTTWTSFREQSGVDHAHPVTLGTLYKMATDAGWAREMGWHRYLLTNSHGKPIACPFNISLILRFTPAYKDLLRFDLFRGVVEYGEQRCDAWGRSLGARRWEDNDDSLLANYLGSEHGMAVLHLGHCTQAVSNVAHETDVDPLVSWLDGLPRWDGIDRLSSFFEDFCGTEKSPYAAFCGVSLFLSLVARAYAPGCQVDTVLVLEGAEGAKKTSLCRLLGGPWYKAITLSFESKELYTALRHAWVGELAELDSFARSGQARIKSLITTLSDSYRPAYGRNEITQPRRTVFIGTTNEPAYIVDPHGARRFFPIKVEDINIEGVAAVLGQLFAEARTRYQQGESWWDFTPEAEALAREARELAREVDPWEHDITTWLQTHPGEVVIEDILGSLCLNIPSERRTRAHVTRIGTILYRLGYKKKQRRSSTDWNTREYAFVPKNSNVT